MPKISASQRDARRNKVLDAALACFSENGFHQTGIADIVRRSGMSHGAVYGYFQSKDDIIEALADDRHAAEAVLNRAAGQTDDPVEALHALVRGYARSLTDPAGEARRRVGVHGWSEALRNRRVHARIVGGIEIPRLLIVGLVEQAQRIGKLPNNLNADAIARSLIALFQGLTLQATWGEAIDVEACVGAVEHMLLGARWHDREPKSRRAKRA
jgi:AcrR family transcriptional regulator